VKINFKTNILDYIKRFAIPGTWSIIKNLRAGKSYKVMKKGRKVM